MRGNSYSKDEGRLPDEANYTRWTRRFGILADSIACRKHPSSSSLESLDVRQKQAEIGSCGGHERLLEETFSNTEYRAMVWMELASEQDSDYCSENEVM